MHQIITGQDLRLMRVIADKTTSEMAILRLFMGSVVGNRLGFTVVSLYHLGHFSWTWSCYALQSWLGLPVTR